MMKKNEKQLQNLLNYKKIYKITQLQFTASKWNIINIIYIYTHHRFMFQQLYLGVTEDLQIYHASNNYLYYDQFIDPHQNCVLVVSMDRFFN